MTMGGKRFSKRTNRRNYKKKNNNLQIGGGGDNYLKALEYRYDHKDEIPDVEPENLCSMLWVRHGLSGANVVSFGRRKLFIKPFLVQRGRYEAFKVGYETVYNIIKTKGYTKVKFYSSTLPRAMQTAKLISYGLKQALEIDPISGFVSDFIDDRVKIVMGIQETLPGSGESGKFINRVPM